MEVLQRIWQENKEFFLRAGGGLAIFLILNSCVIPGVVGDAGNRRSQNQKLEAEVVRLRNEVIQRAPEEKRDLEELKQIEKEIGGRFLTPLATDVPDPKRGAPQIQFSERIDRIWGDLRAKANQKNVKIPDKITPSDLWVGVGAADEELERSASYLEILGRAMKDCVELGMVQIDKPTLAGEEGAWVRENGESVTVVYRRVSLTVHGPYEAFRRVLREYQKPGTFIQVRLTNLDAKGFGGSTVLRGQLEFVGVLFLAEGEAGEKKEKPPERKPSSSRKRR